MPSRMVKVAIMHRDFEDVVVDVKVMSIDFITRELADAIENAAEATKHVEKDRLHLPVYDIRNHCATLRKLSEHIITPFDFTLKGIDYSVVEEVEENE